MCSFGHFGILNNNHVPLNNNVHEIKECISETHLCRVPPQKDIQVKDGHQCRSGDKKYTIIRTS